MIDTEQKSQNAINQVDNRTTNSLVDTFEILPYALRGSTIIRESVSVVLLIFFSYVIKSLVVRQQN